MKQFRVTAIAVVAALPLLAAHIAGCGGNNSGPGGAKDASADAAEASADGGSETPDATTEGGEGGPEVLPEAAPDAVSDAGSPDSIASDAAAASDSDAAQGCTSATPAANGLLTAAAATVCQHLQGCCALGPGQFNDTLCEQIYGNAAAGWMNIGRLTPYLDGGNISYETDQACQCLQGTSQLSCGTVDQTTWDSLQTTCLAAFAGKSGVDGGCASSYECAPGEYCQTGHTCAKLLGPGGPCTASEQCDYISNGAHALFCDTSDAATANTCVPALEAGTPCQSTAECASALCSAPTPLACRSGVAFASAAVCSFLTNPDAGDGG